MTAFGCGRENEVMQLLRQGYWPEACPADLRAHVGECRICADLVLVTTTLKKEHTQALPQARLEAPGALWWRAQLRRRNKAIEKMARPIFGAEVFALAMALVAAAAVLVWQAGNWSEWIRDLPRALHLAALLPASMGNSGWKLSVAVPVLATIALISGVVVYLASEKQ
jgi:hypothetical protein